MRSNYSRAKLSRMEDFTIFVVFIFADAQVPNIWGEPERAPHLRGERQFCLFVYTVQVAIYTTNLYSASYKILG